MERSKHFYPDVVGMKHLATPLNSNANSADSESTRFQSIVDYLAKNYGA
jgi:hypothetical protein